MITRAYTMQALVKYHGMKNWELRIPYHDSISVNTDCFYSQAELVENMEGGVFVHGRYEESANRRLEKVVKMIDEHFRLSSIYIRSSNHPRARVKGIGFSSSAGAALTLLCYRYIKKKDPSSRELSVNSRLFAASASRACLGGFSRLYAGEGHEDTYAERFADSKTMDLRMVIVPLYVETKTEQAHRDVESSPFFKARIEQAQKRCDMVEKAILSNDLEKLGELVEQDTLELHSITMTGASRTILMTEDSIRIIRKVREMRNDGIKAYFSMQTGPSVFINTEEKYLNKVYNEVVSLGYRPYVSGVGGSAFFLES